MKKSKIAVLVLSLGLLFGGISGIQQGQEVKNNGIVRKYVNYEETESYKLVFPGTGNSAYDKNEDITCDNLTWNVSGNLATKSNYVYIGGKSLNNVKRVIYSKTSINANIGKIVINNPEESKSLITVNKLEVGVYGTADDAAKQENELDLVEGTFNNGGSSTIEFNRDKIGTQTELYFAIMYTVKNTTTSNKRLRVGNILFYQFGSVTAEETKTEITSLSTKAQLSYSFTKEEENYSFTNMKLNFGSFIHKDKLTALTSAKSTVTSYGVAIAKHSSLASTETVSSALSAKKTYVKAFEKVYDTKTFAYTDETGTLNEGDYVAFSADVLFGDKTAKYVDVYDAVAYVVVDGDYVFLQERSCSVSSLADEYVASSAFTTFSASIQASLQALGALND